MFYSLAILEYITAIRVRRLHITNINIRLVIECNTKSVKIGGSFLIDSLLDHEEKGGATYAII